MLVGIPIYYITQRDTGLGGMLIPFRFCCDALTDMCSQRASRAFGRGYAEDQALAQVGKQSQPREMSRSRCYGHLTNDMESAAPRAGVIRLVSIHHPRGPCLMLDDVTVLYS